MEITFNLLEQFTQIICQSTGCEKGRAKIINVMYCNDIMWELYQDRERQAGQLLRYSAATVKCLYFEPEKLKLLKRVSSGSERVLHQHSIAAKQGTLPRPAHNQHIKFITFP